MADAIERFCAHVGVDFATNILRFGDCGEEDRSIHEENMCELGIQIACSTFEYSMPGLPYRQWFIRDKFPRPIPFSAVKIMPSLHLLKRIGDCVATSGTQDECRRLLYAVFSHSVSAGTPWAYFVTSVPALVARVPSLGNKMMKHFLKFPDNSWSVSCAALVVYGLAAARVHIPNLLSFLLAFKKHGLCPSRLPVAARAAYIKVTHPHREWFSAFREWHGAVQWANPSLVDGPAFAMFFLGCYLVLAELLSHKELANLSATWYWVEDRLRKKPEDLTRLPHSICRVVRKWKLPAENNREDDCPICYEVGHKPWARLACGHHAHADCLYGWATRDSYLPQSYDCPLCLAKMDCTFNETRSQSSFSDED